VRIGIDLGGTKIEAIALDREGRELARRRVPTPREDYEGTLAAIVALVSALEQETARRGTSVWLNGRPLAQDLERRLGRTPRFANDANCFALSEALDGAGEGSHTVFGVIVGTGTGGGVVVEGRVLTGPNAIAGEWAHNPLPWPGDGEWPGPPCYCGKTACIETFLSGPGLSRDHEALTGVALEPAAIVARAAASDAAAEATLRRYEDRMSRALATVINVIDPDVIVLGGGMSKLARLYEAVPRLWQRWVFSDRVDTRLVPPRHGDSSGVRGAAWLWGLDEP
jgi:fructokinase